MALRPVLLSGRPPLALSPEGVSAGGGCQALAASFAYSVFQRRPHPGEDNVLSDKQPKSPVSAWSGASLWPAFVTRCCLFCQKSKDRTDLLTGPFISPILRQEVWGSKTFINIRVRGRHQTPPKRLPGPCGKPVQGFALLF